MLGAPAADRLDLGVFAHADHDHEAPLLRGLLDDAVDHFHLWAGGVRDGGSPLFQRCVDRRRGAVRADHHGLARAYLGRIVDHAQTAAAELGDHVLVMDDRPETAGAAVLGEQLLRHVHAAAHTEAEAGAFGNSNLLHALISRC